MEGALPQGTRLGHCEIHRVLGRGGGGISYLAYDAHLEREVVIKEHFPPMLCLRTPGAAEVQPVSPEGYERSLLSFCREARILAGLNHPGVVKVYDIFQACGTAYMVMEYVEGERLGDWLPAHAEEVQGVTLVLLQILAALGYLHAHEVLHRDLKPSNIIIRDDAQPVLIDFGAAMLGTPPTTITLVGTPGYAAPEQFQQHGQVGPWSDVYALAHSFGKLLPIKSLRRYPRRFVSSLKRAGEDDIDHRYVSAADWAGALRHGQNGACRVLLMLTGAFLLGAMCVWVLYQSPEAVGGPHADDKPAVPTVSPYTAAERKIIQERMQNLLRLQYRETLEREAENYGYTGGDDRRAWIDAKVEEWVRKMQSQTQELMERHVEPVD